MKTTIEMAREAAGDDWNLFQEFMPEIHRLAELVRADENEACAKVCADLHLEGEDDTGLAADLIRARNNTQTKEQ
jgi:hypothetical protein